MTPARAGTTVLSGVGVNPPSDDPRSRGDDEEDRIKATNHHG